MESDETQSLITGESIEQIQKRRERERLQAQTPYRGVINIDFTSMDESQYQELLAALIQTGWEYQETSALCVEGKLPKVLQCFEVIAKQCLDAGVLSALTIHIQALRPQAYADAQKRPNALKYIQGKRYPWEPPPRLKRVAKTATASNS
jgi:hypothetical protein